MIAALFVETNGCYFNLAEVDPYDIKRDARTYSGDFRVVAHPPCQRWGRFASGSPMKRGETPGKDGGCFISALASVVRCGGVLEHPANSQAWKTYGIPKPPNTGGWIPANAINSWTCQVEQGHYGHVARKATWLFCVSEAKPPELIWGPAGQRLPAKRLAEKGYESARRCGAVANQSQQQRQRTPIPFRDLLLSLAQGVTAHVR